jgi:uncharacterized protein YuzE
MKIEYDREADAVYIYLQEKEVTKTVSFGEGLNIDFDEEGKLIGIEVLDATKRYSLADIFDLRTENLIFDEQFLKKNAGAASDAGQLRDQ